MCLRSPAMTLSGADRLQPGGGQRTPSGVVVHLWAKILPWGAWVRVRTNPRAKPYFVSIIRHLVGSHLDRPAATNGFVLGTDILTSSLYLALCCTTCRSYHWEQEICWMVPLWPYISSALPHMGGHLGGHLAKESSNWIDWCIMAMLKADTIVKAQ